MKLAKRAARSAQAAGVLARAVVRAAESLVLTQKTLAATLGISEASVSRLARGRVIDPRVSLIDLLNYRSHVYRLGDYASLGDEPGRLLELGATPES